MNVRYVSAIHCASVELVGSVARVFQLFRSYSDVPIAEAEASFWLIELIDRINRGQSLQWETAKSRTLFQPRNNWPALTVIQRIEIVIN